MRVRIRFSEAAVTSFHAARIGMHLRESIASIWKAKGADRIIDFNTLSPEELQEALAGYDFVKNPLFASIGEET